VYGADLFVDLDLAPWEAALGAEVLVPTLEGTVKLRVPPGTPNGQTLRVRGRGLRQGEQQRGDLHAVVQVQVPETLTEEEKTAWERLREVSRFRPRG
jgi:curved DNA-binding protein